MAVENRAFDVTPAALVTAIITEDGIARPALRGLFCEPGRKSRRFRRDLRPRTDGRAGPVTGPSYGWRRAAGPLAVPCAAGPGPRRAQACIDELEPPPRRPPPRGSTAWRRLRLRGRRAGAGGPAQVPQRPGRGAVAGRRPWPAWSTPAGLDVVTWVPTTTRRRRGRGFDQAEVLARALARRLGLPCRRLLRRRPGSGPDRAALAERRGAVPGSTARGARPVPAAVLVVDDVVTSGATLAAAAAGAACRRARRRVDAVTAASTPLKLPPTVVDRGGNGTGNRRRFPCS